MLSEGLVISGLRSEYFPVVIITQKALHICLFFIKPADRQKKKETTTTIFKLARKSEM